MCYRYKEMQEHDKICVEITFRKMTTLRERKKDGVALQLNLSFVLYKQKER